ncbi:MAG: glycoside hydrolase family 97 N-terminal domain-containing protein [Rikenellaceae bacterium]
MKKLTNYPFLLLIALFALSCSSQNNSATSPNERLKLEVQQNESGNFVYSFIADGDSLVRNSLLGYQSSEGEVFPSKGWVISSVSQNEVRSTWMPIWGKRRVVKDEYNQIILSLENRTEQSKIKKMEIALRAYDQGVAFRYVIPESGVDQDQTIAISEELTQFAFGGDYTAWFYNEENHNVGPEKLSESDGRRLPVMTIKASADQFMALHEAYLQHGEPMTLSSKANDTTFEVSSTPKVVTSGSESAWRVLFFGENAGAMVDSHLIELLNPDPDPNIDFSWVQPSVALWDWRINGAKVDGFTYGMNYPSWIKMVDFAVENDIRYLVLDANWYGPEFNKDSNPMVGDKANDVRALIAYAKERNVGIWLYLNDIGGRQFPIEQTLKQYGEWGAAGVKYGFMRGSSDERQERTVLITRLCAENKLHVDYHDQPVHPYGQMRTWPNALTREYCFAQLDGHKVFHPITFVTSVFVNMIAGPIDMTNGMFDLRQGHTDRIDESQPVPSTVVSEAARTVIVFSGATIIPDIPEYYNKYPSLLRFISAQKMPWVESKTLLGEIGEYVAMMRETDNHYIVGAAYNENGGELEIPLDFLPDGEFVAELSTDGDAHYLTNRETLQVEMIKVSNNTKLVVKIAPGGGACLLIEK